MGIPMMRYPFQDDCTDIPEEDVEAADSHEDPMRTTMNHAQHLYIVSLNAIFRWE